MAQLWTIACCLLMAVALSQTEACSQPEGYKHQDPERVLASSDVFLFAKFRSRNTFTRDGDDGKVYDLKLNADVLCIMHNSKNATVPKNINITETRKGSLENKENPCIDFFHTIDFNEEVFVMVEQRGEEFGFDIVNLQGPYFYMDEVDEVKLTKMCTTLHSHPPEGGSNLYCPMERANEGNCKDHTVEDDDAQPEAMDTGNGTSSQLLPMGGATMAGLMALHRLVV